MTAGIESSSEGANTLRGHTSLWTGAIAGALVGSVGGILYTILLHGSLIHGALTGAVYGVVFGFCFVERCSSPGAGLIWGLAYAFFLWLLIPAGAMPWLAGRHSMATVDAAREGFPQLTGYLITLGMPLGLVLGLLAEFRPRPGRRGYVASRAIVVGGLAGVVSAIIFHTWMLKGGYFPLTAGISEAGARAGGTGLHLVLAAVIGVAFGLLFQQDIYGYGSSMGWGAGFGIFWWFLGPLTLHPLLTGVPTDWSAEHAANFSARWWRTSCMG